MAEQILPIFTDPGDVAVRSQERRGYVQFLADVDDVVDAVCPALDSEPAGLVKQ